MIDPGDIIERTTLILFSRRNLEGQARNIKRDIARDQEYIDTKTEAFKTRVPTEKEQEHLDDCVMRVGNLRGILQSIDLVLELLDKERIRLKQPPTLWSDE